MISQRKIAACDASAAADYAPDSEGWQRYRAADEAKRHLASMTPERRAMLEREWTGVVQGGKDYV